MDEEYKIIEIRKNYRIAVPKDYSTSLGTGDDTNFAQIYSEDGSIFLGYEYGVSEFFQKRDTSSLKNDYQRMELLKSLGGEEIWIAYSSINTKLRNIKGSVFINLENNFIELLNFSCSSSKLDQVRELASTIKKK